MANKLCKSKMKEQETIALIITKWNANTGSVAKIEIQKAWTYKLDWKYTKTFWLKVMHS